MDLMTIVNNIQTSSPKMEMDRKGVSTSEAKEPSSFEAVMGQADAQPHVQDERDSQEPVQAASKESKVPVGDDESEDSVEAKKSAEVGVPLIVEQIVEQIVVPVVNPQVGAKLPVLLDKPEDAPLPEDLGKAEALLEPNPLLADTKNTETLGESVALSTKIEPPRELQSSSKNPEFEVPRKALEPMIPVEPLQVTPGEYTKTQDRELSSAEVGMEFLSVPQARQEFLPKQKQEARTILDQILGEARASHGVAVRNLREGAQSGMQFEKFKLQVPVPSKGEKVGTKINELAGSLFVQKNLGPEFVQKNLGPEFVQKNLGIEMASQSEDLTSPLVIQGGVGGELTSSLKELARVDMNAKVSEPDGKLVTQNLVEDMEVGLRQMFVSKEGGKMTIHLRPGHLGRVMIDVQVNQGEVRVGLHAEKPGTESVLKSQAHELKSQLQSIGLRVDDVQVQTLRNSANPDSRQESNSAWQEAREHAGKHQQKQDEREAKDSFELKKFEDSVLKSLAA